MELPAASAADAETAPEKAAVIPPEGFPEALTVVYVEDNLSNLQLVEGMLGRLPHRVQLLSATDGRRGLELIRRQRPDAVLLDLQLPGLSGEAILREMRADPALRDVPVLMLSADVTESSRQWLLEAGARAYLGKPLDLHQFLRAVSAALASTLSPGTACQG